MSQGFLRYNLFFLDLEKRWATYGISGVPEAHTFHEPQRRKSILTGRALELRIISRMLSGCTKLMCYNHSCFIRSKVSTNRLSFSQYFISIPSNSSTVCDEKQAPTKQVCNDPNFFYLNFFLGGGN